MNAEEERRLFETLGRIDERTKALPGLIDDVDGLKQSRGWMYGAVTGITIAVNVVLHYGKKLFE